ncbi:class I SAM-dependent methyltransferase [Rickettsiales bacterium]|nr:class I SAM-dependent methyltransferase [Rickettsiales bacterium]
MNILAIKAESEEYIKAAEELSEKLAIDMSNNESDYILLVGNDGLSLKSCKNKNQKPIRVDFKSQELSYRQKHGGRSKEQIAKAVGISQGVRPSIVDVTAGLGKDGFILASLGCKVTMLERTPIVHALLEDGLKRAEDITKNITLYQADSIKWLESCSYSPEVIYMDPMFPSRKKSAAIKKEMRIFHDIVGEDLDSTKLLKIALEKALYRVVVKRPKLSSPIGQIEPTISHEQKSCRFDIYVKKSLKK